MEEDRERSPSPSSRISSWRANWISPAALSTDALAGPSGPITIEAKRVEIRENGRISSSTLGADVAGPIGIEADSILVSGAVGANRARILSETHAGIEAGGAGAITLEADRVEMLDRGLVSSKSRGGGLSGDITITGRDRVRVERDATVTSNGRFAPSSGGGSGQGPGLAGNITIHGGSSVSLRRATIETGSYERDSGHVRISSGGFIRANRLGARNASPTSGRRTESRDRDRGRRGRG